MHNMHIELTFEIHDSTWSMFSESPPRAPGGFASSRLPIDLEAEKTEGTWKNKSLLKSVPDIWSKGSLPKSSNNQQNISNAQWLDAVMLPSNSLPAMLHDSRQPNEIDSVVTHFQMPTPPSSCVILYRWNMMEPRFQIFQIMFSFSRWNPNVGHLMLTSCPPSLWAANMCGVPLVEAFRNFFLNTNAFNIRISQILRHNI